MIKSTVIEDQDRLDYKKRLREFMKTVNPKPSLEQVEQLKQQYFSQRNVKVAE